MEYCCTADVVVVADWCVAADGVCWRLIACIWGEWTDLGSVEWVEALQWAPRELQSTYHSRHAAQGRRVSRWRYCSRIICMLSKLETLFRHFSMLFVDACHRYRISVARFVCELLRVPGIRLTTQTFCVEFPHISSVARWQWHVTVHSARNWLHSP